MFKAEDIMTRNVVTVYSDTAIYDAMNLLVKNKITGLPVIDDNNQLIGILSEKDMLNLLYNEKINNETVSEFMTKETVSFDIEDDITDICDCLINNHFRRVPITDNHKLVGIISRKDIISFILKIRKK